MVHGPRTLTHTIVFVPGEPAHAPRYSDHGSGFLFDDRWRLTATFSASRDDEMVGQCNGLLCFLDRGNGTQAMHIVDPLSGESLTLPVNHGSHRLLERAAYCFGFDPSSRRYKMFHQGQRYHAAKQDLFVYRVGVDAAWRRVQVAVPAPETAMGAVHGNPVFADGSVYWSVVRAGVARLARFDLATEQVTSEPVSFLQAQEGMSLMAAASTMEDVTAPESITFVHDFVCTYLPVVTTEEDSAGAPVRRRRVMTMTLPHGRRLARPHALQRDHRLLGDHDDDRGRYSTQTIALASNYLGCGQFLLDTLKEERPARASSSTRGLFVPAQASQMPAAVATGTRDQGRA
jgi:hypothetical protein